MDLLLHNMSYAPGVRDITDCNNELRKILNSFEIIILGDAIPFDYNIEFDTARKRSEFINELFVRGHTDNYILLSALPNKFSGHDLFVTRDALNDCKDILIVEYYR